jgi:hypothetical protein
VPDLRETISALRLDGRQRNTRCPAHDDQRASLSVGLGRDNRILLKCHVGCDVSAILEAAGLSMAELFERPRIDTRQLRRQRERQDAKNRQRRIVAEYSYTNEHGTMQFQVVRYEPKDFRQRRPDDSGGWIYSTSGMRPLLYRLDKLQHQDSVLIAEGEKDVDRLWSLQLPATCNAGGAGAGKWKAEHTRQLLDAGVQAVGILPDNDDSGRRHADEIARACFAAGLRVRVVTLPGLPEHGDVSDFLQQHSKDELVAFAKATPLYTGNATIVTSPDARMIRVTPASTIEPRPVHYLWADRIPIGTLNLLGGREGIGKSIFACTVAADITQGRLPGVHFGAPRAVLIAATEDSWSHTIVPRLLAAGVIAISSTASMSRPRTGWVRRCHCLAICWAWNA